MNFKVKGRRVADFQDVIVFKTSSKDGRLNFFPKLAGQP